MNFKDKIRNFMIGRNGHDELNFFIIALVGILLIVNIFAKKSFILTLALIFLIYSYYRSLSRDISARQSENKKFLDTVEPLRRKFSFSKNKVKNRKVYKYFKCPKCGLQMKVPRGKGKILVTCKKCGEKFTTES